MRQGHRSARQRRLCGYVQALTALAMILGSSVVSRAAPPSDGASAAHSSPDRAGCSSAYVSAQELRKAGKLVEAQKKLVICASSACPPLITSDCITWSTEVEQATPSLVLEIEVDGHAPSEAKVAVDQVPVADWSRAVKVDPGSHVVRVEVPSFDPREEKIVMVEGHRMRMVPIKFETPRRAAQPLLPDAKVLESPPGTTTRAVPVITYPLLGAGVLGLAGFAVFGALGKAKQNDLEGSCVGHCTSNDLNPMKTDYLVGDISLGVGVAALVGATVVYLARPSQNLSKAPVTSFMVGPMGEHMGSWGASTTIRW